MTSKEAIARLEGNILSDPFDRSNDVNLNDLRIVGSQMQNEYLEEIETIKKDLEMLEELKNPYDEYENENYLCTREAYYNENIGELCFAYTIFKWDGTYREHKAPILEKSLKMKNWVEVFHTGCGTGKKELNEEYIQDYLKLKEIMKKEVVKK